MKRLLIILMLLYCSVAGAQTWEEWTQQERLRIQRLQEQLLANQVFMELGRKGIAVLDGGLKLVHTIKNKEVDMHRSQQDSLGLTATATREWLSLSSLLRMQERLMQQIQQLNRQARASGQFTPAELDYCRSVCDRLSRDMAGQLQEVLGLLRPGEWKMPDEERLKRLEACCKALSEGPAFLASFQNELMSLALQRLTEQTEINYSKKLK